MPTPPPIPDPRQRKPRAISTAVPFHHLLYGLFFHPAVLVVLQADSWRRAFRRVTLLCLLCGALVSLARLPTLLKAADDWGRWMSRELVRVEWRQGKLHWERPQALPYTTRHRGWRVDFAAEGSSFPAEPFAGPEQQGLWLTPSEVFFWERLEGKPPRPIILLKDGKLLDRFELAQMRPDGFSLRGEEFSQETRRLMLQAAPVLALQGALEMFFKIVLYVLLFTLIPFVLRSPLAAAGFTRMLTFYLYASIPPLIVAAIYGSLHLPYLNMATLFVFSFVGYLLLVGKHLRQTFTTGRPQAL